MIRIVLITMELLAVVLGIITLGQVIPQTVPVIQLIITAVPLI